MSESSFEFLDVNIKVRLESDLLDYKLKADVVVRDSNKTYSFVYVSESFDFTRYTNDEKEIHEVMNLHLTHLLNDVSQKIVSAVQHVPVLRRTSID